EAVTTVIDLLRTNGSCDEDVVNALVRTPKMRSILGAAARERIATQQAKQQAVNRERTLKARMFHSRYDRKRLYDEVWAEPTQKVAEKYGVTGTAIAKACKVLEIPKPPRGYWAKKASGHEMPAAPPLPSRDK